MDNHLLHFPLLLLLTLKTLSLHPTSAIDFIFNGFNSSDLLFYGNSSIESKILSLTNDSTFSIGRVLYPIKIPTKSLNSSSNSSNHLLPFSTSFIFSISPIKNVLPGHGLVFLFTPNKGIQGTSSSQHLGLFNLTNNGDPNNHVFGIEFDLFSNPEFNDINNNHVGININSLTSIFAQPAGYWTNEEDEEQMVFHNLTLNNGVNYQVWVDYFDSKLSVNMAPIGVNRPNKPLINISLDLSKVFMDEMYVGFCGSTGRLVERHRILAWSFSNSNFSVGNSLITSHLPSFVLREDSGFRSKALVIGIPIGIVILVGCGIGVAVFLIKRKRKKRWVREEMEEWELEYWPHRINYEVIFVATKGFSEENVIGIGGNGKVYKGEMGGIQIAVKRFRHENEQGMKEFLAEISSLGRLKHRNLVGLRGWCKKEKGSLILVYDYMENGSLDKMIFESEGSLMLSWEDRVRVLKDVAIGVLYLHEGWEAKVLHRDIKASNVLLDKEMSGRLGDFGLARMHDHGQVPSTTHVVGTVGYMAPEIIKNGRASTQTDVYGFGVLVLEVVCGRRPVEDGKLPLVNWVLSLKVQGELLKAVDEKLREHWELNEEEVERILRLGLLCTHPNPDSRPLMRQVVKVLEARFDNEGSEEGFDVYLHEKLNSMPVWSSYDQGLGHGKHPTFREVSSSMSLSWSDIISEGR